MIQKGLILDDTGDLDIQAQRDDSEMIVSGLAIGETDFQCIDMVVIANKGDFKEYPVLGVGAEKYLKSVDRAAEFRREISVQLEAIGYPKADVKVSDNGELEIDV